MLISLFILFAIILASLIFAFLLASVLHSDKEELDTSMDAIIQTNMALIVTSTIDLFSEITNIVSSKTLLFVSGLPGQSLNLARFGAIAGAAVVFHESYTYFLTGGDTMFRTLLGPLFQDVIFSIMQIIRLVFDAIIPIYNYYSTVFGQITSGSVSIALKCDLMIIIETFKLLVFSFIELFKSVVDFAGGQSIDNNIMVNDWNITKAMSNTQDIIGKQEELASCVCNGLTDILDILFVAFKTPHFPRLLNHAWNIPISLIQGFLQILPPYTTIPHLSKFAFHVGSFGLEFAKYWDLVLTTAFSKVVALVVPGFELKGLPEQFLLATMARLWLAGVEIVHTLFRTAIHIVVPLQQFISDPVFMSQAMDFSKVFIHLELFNYGIMNFIHWVFLIVKQLSLGLLRSANDEGFQITGLPEHVTLDCSTLQTSFESRLPCLLYHAVQVPISTAHIAQKFILELLWFSIIFQRQNAWRTIQKYDGMIQSNDIPYTCQHRRDEMKWDVTKTTCVCERPIDNFPYPYETGDTFGVQQTFYRPYCGQPTLQANVWHHFIMWFRQATEGQILDPFFILAKTVYFGAIETTKLAFRLVLALPDIFEGKFIDVPINCGWGTGDFRNCSIRKHRRNSVNWCSEVNEPGCTCNPSLPLNYTTLCQCIYYYPDPEQEVAQEAFYNNLLKNLYSPVARHHWCGSYSAESVLALSEDFAYSIDSVAAKFAPAYNSNSNLYCQSKAYKLLSTDVLQYTDEEWNTALLDPINKYFTKNSCNLYGSYDVICSASMTIRTGVMLFTQQTRALIMTILSMLSLDVAGFKVDLSERLCDLQRTAAAASGTVAAVFPVGFVGRGVQQGLARMMYSGFDVVIVVIRFVNNFLLWFSDVIRGAAVGRSPEQATFSLIINQLNLLIDWLRRVLQAFGTFMNGLVNGAGAFFFTLDTILKIFQSILSEAVMELTALFFKVSAGIIEIFTNGRVVEGFFDDIFTLIKKFVGVMVKLGQKITDLVLALIPPVMKAIEWVNGVAVRTCEALSDALSYFGRKTLRCSRRRRLEASNHMFWSVPDTPLYIAEQIDWSGNSRCDLMVHRYKNYTWNQLRPIEQIDIQECLEQRILAERLANSTGLPIPVDIFYNWKRKYTITSDTVQASILYVKHNLGEISTSEMLREFKSRNINSDLYMSAFSSIKTFSLNAFSFRNIDWVIHETFKQFPDIESTKSGVGNMYRLYKHSNTFVEKAYPSLTKLPFHFRKLANSIPSSHVLKRNFNITKHVEQFASHLRSIPPLFKSVSKKRPMSHSKIKARSLLSPILGAAGVDADLTPCNQRSDTYVCVNCIIVDNILNTAVKEGFRMAAYYENTFAPIIVPDFVKFFEQEQRRPRPYRTSISDQMEQGLKTAYTKATTNSQTNSTRQLSNNQLAQKDWDYLFKNWQLRNNEDIVDILIRFVGTTDDTYIPLFAYGLGYYITYPFTEACPMEIIYCDTSTTQERVNYISQQFVWQGVVFGGIFIGQLYTGAPIFGLATGFPAMLIIMGAIYMWTVYSYIYTCAPNIPNCFMDDLYVWFHDVAYPDCFCTYFPGLSDSCDPELCFASDRVTSFSNCTAEVPLSTFDNMGYFWSPVFWFRKEFPDAFLWLYKTPPFSYGMKNFEGIKDIALRLQSDVPITLQEIDCLGLRYSDIVLIGVVIYVVSFVFSIIIPIAIKIVVHIFKLAILMANAMFAFGVATELQTIVGVEED